MRADIGASVGNNSSVAKSVTKYADAAQSNEMLIVDDKDPLRGSLNENMYIEQNQEYDDSKMTFEQALKMAGGFGRFQCFSTALMIFLFNTGSSLIYGMTFLELEPQYLCLQDGEWQSCKSDYICSNDL